MSENPKPKQPEHADSSEQPTEILSDDKMGQLAAELSARLVDPVAESITTRLTGRDRPGEARRERHQSTIDQSPAMTPENFGERVHREINAVSQTRAAVSEEHYEVNRQNIVAREKLSKLSRIAAAVASELNERASKEKEVHGDLSSPTPYDPEVTVEHRWFERKTKRLPKINRLDTTPRVTGSQRRECATGWLLARTASIMDKRPVVQEVLLGQDGKLYAYATDDQRHIEKLFGNPHSRKQLQDSGQDITSPWNTQLSNLPLPKGTQYDEKTDPAVKNFYLADGSTYPLPGIGKDTSIFADPEVIQRGLEELFIEKELD